MCGKSGEEVGPLSGLSKANTKGTTKADASGLKPNSPCCQRGELAWAAGAWLAGAVPALVRLLVRTFPALPACPSPSQTWWGAQMGLCSQLADRGKPITSWSLDFSHSTQRTAFVALLKYFPWGSFARRTPSRHNSWPPPSIYLPVVLLYGSLTVACVFVSLRTPPLVLRDCAGRQTLFQGPYFW